MKIKKPIPKNHYLERQFTLEIIKVPLLNHFQKTKTHFKCYQNSRFTMHNLLRYKIKLSIELKSMNLLGGVRFSVLKHLLLLDPRRLRSLLLPDMAVL